MKKTHTRKFLGKTEGFVSREEQRMEAKHLKAYLKGWERFQYGYTTIPGTMLREPIARMSFGGYLARFVVYI